MAQQGIQSSRLRFFKETIMSLDAAQMSISKYETNMMLKQTGLLLTSVHLCVALRKVLVGEGRKVSTVAISSSFWGTIPYNPYLDPKSM